MLRKYYLIVSPLTECILEALRLCWNAIILYLRAKSLFKVIVQFKGLACYAHIVTLLWLILTAELNITLLNPQFGNASEMAFFLSGHIISTLCLRRLSNIGNTQKIKFTMNIEDENKLEFLDLLLM